MATIKTGAETELNLIKLTPDSMDGLYQYATRCKQLAYQQWNIRQVMMYADKQYARENDYTNDGLKAKIANYQGDANKFANITVPVVMEQVESAVTYQSSVFLTGTPLFGVVASPEHMAAAKQLETIIDSQAVKGGWTRQLILTFLSAFKYNLYALEVDWAREQFPAVESSIGSPNGAKVANYAWEGNKIKAWDMYNTFWDVRYGPSEVSAKGEFAGCIDLCSRIEIKKYLAQTPNIISSNITAALESPTIGVNISNDTSQLSYYVPQISQSQTVNPTLLGEFNWLAWAQLEPSGKRIDYKNIYQKTKIYARILPSDFNMRTVAPNTPQIWKLEFINNVLIYAQPVITADDMLPVLIGQPYEDGLKYQTKSLASNASDFQNVASAMMNSMVHSRRRAVSDRVLYDPSRVAAQQINSDNPSAKIPVRPAAYGKNIQEAVYAFPYRDDQAGLLMQEINQVVEMANRVSQQNKAKQGQFVKGNKTRREFDSVMANANGRDQRTAMMFEAQLFTPLKTQLKFNILRNQTPATLYSRDLKTMVKVDPVQLRKAVLEFKVSDGLIPAEKLIQGEALDAALNTIAVNPAIGAAYNIGPMFSYLMKTQGADLEDFEKSPQQVAYEQAAAQWQNSVQVMSEQMIKAGQMPTSANFPPQPKPADYGYTPGAQKPETGETSSVLTQFTATESQEGENNGTTAS